MPGAAWLPDAASEGIHHVDRPSGPGSERRRGGAAAVRAVPSGVRRRPDVAARHEAGLVAVPAVPLGAARRGRSSRLRGDARGRPVSRRRNGPGTARSRRRPSRVGHGTVWLVADRAAGDFRCYWYGGTNDGHLQETCTVGTAADAVAWGRRRTPQVRIRTRDGFSSWAGTARRPSGISNTWVKADLGPAGGDAGGAAPAAGDLDPR